VLEFSLRDVFDVPDLSTTNDDIVNGTRTVNDDGSMPLAPFTAQRVDYSLARLAHYTATDAAHFQNHVLFTNYQFYVDEFEAYARAALADKSLGYTGFVATGNQEITSPDGLIIQPTKMPQMPTYHLKRADGQGITLVNIGVGPSNAKTATDHIAVLRPHAWLMVGHCAGLRNSQRMGETASLKMSAARTVISKGTSETMAVNSATAICCRATKAPRLLVTSSSPRSNCNQGLAVRQIESPRRGASTAVVNRAWKK
jgi:AMP nucleosidase